MKLSSIFISVFLLCAAIFFGRALWIWYSPWSFLSGVTLVGAGGYCVLVACLIWWSRGLDRGMFMGISAAIVMVYILRLLVLTFAPDEFAHKFLPVVFSSETVNSALLFMAGSTVALALGLRLASWLLPSSRKPLVEGSEKSFLFQHRGLVIVVGYAFAFLHLILQLTVLGIGVSRPAGEFWFVKTLMPLFFLLLVLMYILVRHWRRLALVERWLIVGVFLVGYVATISRGGRTTMLGTIIILLMVALALNPDIRLRVSRWIVPGILVIFVFLPLMQLSLIMRVDWTTGAGFSMDTVADQFVDSPLPFSLREAPIELSRLRPGVDALIAVMNYRPPRLGEEINLPGLGRRIVNRLSPGNLLAEGDKSWGEIFGQKYQGVREGSLHSGGWYGFGITYALFGSMGPLALLVYAIIVGTFIRWALTILGGSSGIIRDASVPVLAFFYWGFGYTLIRSGNMDNVFSGMMRELVIGLLVLAFIQMVGSTIRYYRLRPRLDNISLGKGT